MALDTDFPLKYNSLSTTTLDHIIEREKNILTIREKSLQRGAESLFKLFDGDGEEINSQRRFVKIPSCFFNWTPLFSGSYAMFTNPKQTLPYIFSVQKDKFRVLTSPVSDGYTREHITASFEQSLDPKLYRLYYEQ